MGAIDDKIHEMWVYSSIEDIQSAIQDILDAHQYWSDDYVSFINRNTWWTGYPYYYYEKDLTTSDGTPYQFVLFNRLENIDACDDYATVISESDISDEAKADGWMGIATEIYYHVWNHCQGHSIIIRADVYNFVSSPEFPLWDECPNFLGYDYFAMYIY